MKGRVGEACQAEVSIWKVLVQENSVWPEKGRAGVGRKGQHRDSITAMLVMVKLTRKTGMHLWKAQQVLSPHIRFSDRGQDEDRKSYVQEKEDGFGCASSEPSDAPSRLWHPLTAQSWTSSLSSLSHTYYNSNRMNHCSSSWYITLAIFIAGIYCTCEVLAERTYHLINNSVR